MASTFSLPGLSLKATADPSTSGLGAGAGLGIAGTLSSIHNGIASLPPTTAAPPRTFTIPAMSEYRFESTCHTIFTIKLVSGKAEIFGTELAPGRVYTFGGGDTLILTSANSTGGSDGAGGSGGGEDGAPGGGSGLGGAGVKERPKWASSKGAVFTWHGCEISVDGPVESEYVASETEMWPRLNLHCALENKRSAAAAVAAEAAAEAGSQPGTNAASTAADWRTKAGGIRSIGPRVLILGPPDSGKTSLAKTLTAYAVKMDHPLTVVNLDPAEGMVSVPAGTVSATTFSSGLNVEEGWGTSVVTGGLSPLVPEKNPLVYYFGLSGPEQNVRLFKAQVTRLALAVMSKFERDPAARKAGCVIDLTGCVGGGKYELVGHIVSEFDVNVIVTIGSERVYNDMVRKYPSTPSRPPSADHDPVTVIKLPKSEGCVARDAAHARVRALGQTRDYFFGHTPTAPLTPYSQTVDFSTITLVRVLGLSAGPAGAAGSTTGAATAAAAALRSFLPGGDDGDDSEASASASASARSHSHILPAGVGLYERVAPSGTTLKPPSTVVAVVRAPGGPNVKMEDVRDGAVVGFLLVVSVDEAKGRVTVLTPMSGRIPAGVWVLGGAEAGK